MKRTVDDDTREIIESFIAEAHERLDEAEVSLQRLGGDNDREILNAVFRLFHSVKGSAGFLEFDRVKSLTHEAEALLEVFIKEGIPYTQDALDVIYATIDALRDFVAVVERDFSDEECAGTLDGHLQRIKSTVAILKGGAAAAAAGASQGTAPSGPQGGPEAAGPSSGEGTHKRRVNEIQLNDLVTRDMAERFLVESADLVERVERDALALDGVQDKNETVHSMFRAIHTIKGNAGFFAYAALETDCKELEGFLDAARKGERPLNEAFVNGVLSRIDSLSSLMSAVRYIEADGSLESLPADPSADGIAAASVAEASSGRVSSAASPAPEVQSDETAQAGQEAREPAAGSVYRPLGEILTELGAAEEASVRKALEEQEKPIGQLLVEQGVVKNEDVEKALEIQRSMGGAEKAPVEDIRRKEIRVDTAKLDKLFDLVGELITAEAMVANSPDLAGLKLDAFNKSFSALAKISREIQETAMMIRMIPLESLFHKMARLVRDLSRKFSKPVDFRVSGEETEMDKNVIEQISDPLVHILRNALDHGLEMPSERRVSGKVETGVLSLDARYEGSEIWISIKDDGKGLNRERILRKAMERGLIAADATPSDKELWQYIFEPGFSTATVVSDVSGRGVGMDVVKRNLEKIRGRIDVRTEAGKGTEFILQIPLTMAIIDGITVRVGRSYYSVPLSDILEFFKARPDQITRTERGQETVNLRGTVMPLLKLAEIFRVADGCMDVAEGIVLVVQSAGKRACLLIDEVVGNQQIVIKSLSEYIGKVQGLSGCSILGDGTVSFIVDTGRLLGLRLE